MPSPFARCEILSVACRGVAQAAAYGTRREALIERTGVLYRPRHRDDWIAGDLLLPRGAPAAWRDAHTLWSAVERRARGRVTTVGLDLMLVLPREDELTHRECLDLARAFAQPFLADRLPVQIDLHRVAGADGGAGHRHAHLVVGLYPVAAGVLAPKPARRWLPIQRGSHVHALDWSRPWSVVQETFFAERAIDLGVPPPTPEPEPRIRGRRVTRAGGALFVPARPDARQAQAAARAERRERLLQPAAVLDTMTRDWASFTRASLDALLASGLGDPDDVARVGAAVLAHPDLIALGDRLAQGLYTTRAALARAEAALRRLRAMGDVEVSLAPEPRLLREALDAVSRRAIAGRRDPWVVWADPVARVDHGGLEPLRGRREVAARDLPDGGDGRDGVRRWSPRTVVAAVGIERWTDHEVEALIARAARAGAALRILVGAGEAWPPRREAVLWPLVVEALSGMPVRTAGGLHVALLSNRLAVAAARGWITAPGAERDVLAAAGPSPRWVVRGAAPEPADGPDRAGAAPDEYARAIPPREAWRAPAGALRLLVREPADWRWAGPLVLARPDAEVAFATALTPEAFVRAVADLEERPAAALLRAVMGEAPAAEDDPWTDADERDLALEAENAAENPASEPAEPDREWDDDPGAEDALDPEAEWWDDEPDMGPSDASDMEP